MGKVGPSGGGQRTESITVPAADYLVALAYFQHKLSGKGNAYLNCKWEVIAGPFRGKGFWAMMNLDLENEYTRKRWEGYLSACGLRQAIELEGNEGVRNLTQHCRGVPVKMAVKNKPFNGRQSNEVAFFHWPSKLSEAEKKAMSAWQNKEAPAEESYAGTDSAGKRHHYGEDGYGGPGFNEPTPNDSGPGYGDTAGDDADDIPF